mmetsp:Transcript_139386/g.353488  ORF Transcript_139386/g.353488 Transcript_139386/m.353488 type:complete len:247 (+) Transcript_139386:682-1422(+)
MPVRDWSVGTALALRAILASPGTLPQRRDPGLHLEDILEDLQHVIAVADVATEAGVEGVLELCWLTGHLAEKVAALVACRENRLPAVRVLPAPVHALLRSRGIQLLHDRLRAKRLASRLHANTGQAEANPTAGNLAQLLVLGIDGRLDLLLGLLHGIARLSISLLGGIEFLNILHFRLGGSVGNLLGRVLNALGLVHPLRRVLRERLCFRLVILCDADALQSIMDLVGRCVDVVLRILAHGLGLGG